MSNTTRLSFLTLALVAAGVGAWFVLREQPIPEVTPPNVEVQSPTPAPTPEQVTMQAQKPVDAPPTEARTEVKVDRTGRKFDQGVHGIIESPHGGVAADCRVFLMESASGGEIFRMMTLAQRGVTLPPVASGTTDAQGQFALGVEFSEPNKAFELRVVSDRFADLVQPGIRLQENNWYDAGRLKLKAGLSLVGQVTAAGSAGMPIADAEVSVRSASGPFEVSVTPGRERGLTAKTDAAGFYRFDNVPAGVHNVAAVAPGYARVTNASVTISENAENRLTFELPRGLSIAGTVADPKGSGVGRARVTAIAISSKAPVTADAITDDAGKFEILGLVEGPYQVTAAADGFIDATEKPIAAGVQDLALVLEKQGSVMVHVMGKNGQTLREYTLTTKTYFPGQPAAAPANAGQATAGAALTEPTYGNTMIPPKNIRNPKDGIALVDGLNPGTYVMQVNARGYAMAFSEAFSVGTDGDAPIVEVQMDEGGVIEGIVVSANGQPLPGVTVETRPNDLDDNPFTNMFQSMIPSKITRGSMKTNELGAFQFKLLNPGHYQIKASHPEHIEVFKKNHQVIVGQTLTMQPIVMMPGCVLTGTVRVSGKPTAQVKVSINTKNDPNMPPADRPPSFMAEAYTDAQGVYRMPKRLPPGLYEVMAAQQTLENPLYQIVQFQKSKQEIAVGAQGQMMIDFSLDPPQ